MPPKKTATPIAEIPAALPVPQSGGSYVRQPDGALTLTEEPTQDPEADSDVGTEQPIQE